MEDPTMALGPEMRKENSKTANLPYLKQRLIVVSGYFPDGGVLLNSKWQILLEYYIELDMSAKSDS